MRIVHVEECFFPQTGYQLNLLAKYMAKDGHEVIIISSEIEKLPEHLASFFGKEDLESQDREYEKKFGVKIIRRPVYGYCNRKNFLRFGFLKYLETLTFIKNLQPDILYVHGNDTIFGILSILLSKNWKFPLVLDSHMLDMASNGDSLRHLFRTLYKYMITPMIKKRNLTVIRTQNDDYVERCLGIPLSQAPWISVGSDVMLFKPDYFARCRFRKKHEILAEDFVVVYSGKLVESKGGLLLAQAFIKKFNNVKNKKVVLLIVGSIPEGEYGDQIKQAFQVSENRILQFPTQKYSQLAVFYQAADLSVFPKQCSLSFYDVQACGLPIVSEDNNINVDRLQSNNGFNFESGNVEDFRKKIVQCIEMDNDEYTTMRTCAKNYVVKNYSYEDIARHYMDVIINTVRGHVHRES